MPLSCSLDESLAGLEAYLQMPHYQPIRRVRGPCQISDVWWSWDNRRHYRFSFKGYSTDISIIKSRDLSLRGCSARIFQVFHTFFLCPQYRSGFQLEQLLSYFPIHQKRFWSSLGFPKSGPWKEEVCGLGPLWSQVQLLFHVDYPSLERWTHRKAGCPPPNRINVDVN